MASPEDLRAAMERLRAGAGGDVREGRGIDADEDEEMYYEEAGEQPPAVKFLVDWGLRPFVAGASLAIGMSIGYSFYDGILCLGIFRSRSRSN